jgi:saccharopine dehydrogenase-like NADP-dependent oxidoreductase
MHRIVVVGAGKIGSMIAELLASCGDYAVTVVDLSQQHLDRLPTGLSIQKIAADIREDDALQKACRGSFAVRRPSV